MMSRFVLLLSAATALVAADIVVDPEACKDVTVFTGGISSDLIFNFTSSDLKADKGQLDVSVYYPFAVPFAPVAGEGMFTLNYTTLAVKADASKVYQATGSVLLPPLDYIGEYYVASVNGVSMAPSRNLCAARFRSSEWSAAGAAPLMRLHYRANYSRDVTIMPDGKVNSIAFSRLIAHGMVTAAKAAIADPAIADQLGSPSLEVLDAAANLSTADITIARKPIPAIPVAFTDALTAMAPAGAEVWPVVGGGAGSKVMYRIFSAALAHGKGTDVRTFFLVDDAAVEASVWANTFYAVGKDGTVTIHDKDVAAAFVNAHSTQRRLRTDKREKAPFSMGACVWKFAVDEVTAAPVSKAVRLESSYITTTPVPAPTKKPMATATPIVKPHAEVADAAEVTVPMVAVDVRFKGDITVQIASAALCHPSGFHPTPTHVAPVVTVVPHTKPVDPTPVAKKTVVPTPTPVPAKMTATPHPKDRQAVALEAESDAVSAPHTVDYESDAIVEVQIAPNSPHSRDLTDFATALVKGYKKDDEDVKVFGPDMLTVLTLRSPFISKPVLIAGLAALAAALLVFVAVVAYIVSESRAQKYAYSVNSF